MNKNKIESSLHEFCRKNQIQMDLLLNIPKEKLEQYFSQIPKKTFEKTRKSLMKRYSDLTADEIEQRLTLIFHKEILEIQNETWKSYKETVKNIPSYLILQSASDIVWDYSDEKQLVTISRHDDTDDFVQLWDKLEQLGIDLQKIATIDKAIQTIQDMSKISDMATTESKSGKP